jgi:hypothetical protein
LTVPAGRFLLDLPADACPWFGRQGFNEAGPFIQVLPAPDPGAARALVEARAETLGIPHEEGGTQLERLVEGPLPHSWLIYFWKDTAFKDETLALNACFWAGGLLFIFKNSCRPGAAPMAARADLLAATFGRLRRRAPLEIPPEPGFCLREAWFPGPADPRSDEHIELRVSFPARPGLSIRLCTDTVGEVVAQYPRLLDRDARGARGARLRARERPLGPFPGQELVRRKIQPDGRPSWACTWEYLGRAGDPLSPMLMLEMKVGGKPGQQLPAGFSEFQALALWDAVLGSLRRRESFLRYLRLPEPFRSS